MNKYRCKHLVYLAVLVFLLVFSISPINAEDGLIHNIDDLNHAHGSDYHFNSSTSSKPKEEIIILYNNESSNNIGSLGLMEKDFESGETLNERMDVLVTSGQTPADNLIEDIENNENVKAVDYDFQVKALDINDKYFQEYQKDIFNQVNANNSVTLGFENLAKVAVLDTGLDPGHEDIQGKYLLEGYNSLEDTNDIRDDQGHGTFISGLISANTNNEIGIAGFTGTNNVKVVPYKVLDSNGEGPISGICDAMMDINKKNDIRIINLSLGFDRESVVLEKIIDELYANNKLVIAASGNDGKARLLYPARYDKVISVGAVDYQNKRCTSEQWGNGNGSCYGNGLDFVAPGNEVYSLELNGGYTKGSGTSYACPIVTSLIALVIEKEPSLSNEEILNKLTSEATDLGSQGYDKEYGYGIINFDDSINLTEENPKEPDIPDVETLGLSPISLDMVINQVSQIQANTTSSKPVIWSSSNPNVASVSNNGFVWAKGPGRVKITAQLTGTDIVAETQVNISNIDNLSITAHCQDIGWKPSVKSLELVGTTGLHKQLEAFRIGVADQGLSINTKVHVSDLGDLGPIGENGLIGTTGRNLGIEAINFDVSGPNAQNYNLYYRAHVENYGWTSWGSSGQWVGTKGKNLQIEAFEIEVIPKNIPAPNINGDVNWSFLS